PAWFEARWNGQTPGKRAMGIAVLNDDGTPLRWPGALTRNLLRAVDFLPFLYGIGLAAMLINRDFKRLGDLAAGTVVVYRGEKSAGTRQIPKVTPVPPPVPLTLEDQRAVLELAERAQTLTAERFEELAALPTPLVGQLQGQQAAVRLLGMANYLAGKQ
ncbi:MAG TPA: RDD family protein, partial [Burkholderiales bacterium]|nr:RDD family protein [Burkholderiales bacterium]